MRQKKIILSECKKKKIKWIKMYMKLFKNYENNRYIDIIDNRYYTFKDIFSHFDIYTTRFNNLTYNENKKLKKTLSWNGCLYGVDKLQQHCNNKALFVLDMNNEMNKIMSIGLITCNISKNQDIEIYSNCKYNNYIYKGKYYIQIYNNPEIHYIWKNFIYNEFEKILFFGKSNQKRSNGITRFPLKHIIKEHILFILKLFIYINPNNFVENLYFKDFIDNEKN
tara:strand:- start:49 stop:717 length:669 start_codon:yes stop_codon:yes gene_type:complete